MIPLKLPLFFCLSILMTQHATARAAWQMDTDVDQYRIERDELDKREIITFGKSKKDSDPDLVFTIQQKSGVLQTGLTPAFDANADCRDIDEYWAKDYTIKRGKPAHHKGIDIPAPRGTEILAVADGTVVGLFLNKKNPKGIEIVLRHTPEDTGRPFWTYSQYTHLLELPGIPLGARVRKGTPVGKTSNSGLSGQEVKRKNQKRHKRRKRKDRVRRNAVHFAIFYSDTPYFFSGSKSVIPKDGFFMDPNAFYRTDPPYDSATLKNLPASEKQVHIAYKTQQDTFVPADTKVIWPYSCTTR